jgi:hypothetical protein
MHNLPANGPETSASPSTAVELHFHCPTRASRCIITSDAHEDPLAGVGVSTCDMGAVYLAVCKVRLWP